MDTKLLNLTNPEFTFTFDNKDYTIKKASMRQVIAYQERIKELQKDSNSDSSGQLKAAAYAVFLLLKPKMDDLTEDGVLDSMRGDVDLLDLLVQLGFMNPEKALMAKSLQSGVIRKLTGDKSSPTSQTEPDGLPEKSETSPSNS